MVRFCLSLIILVIWRCVRTDRTILVTMGASNRYLEDLIPDIPRGWFFETVFKPKLSSMIIWVIWRCFWTDRTTLTTMGASNRFLENLSPDMPKDWFSETVFDTKVVKYDHISNLKVILNSQNHPDHQGSLQKGPWGPEPGQGVIHEQGISQGVLLEYICWNKTSSGWLDRLI